MPALAFHRITKRFGQLIANDSISLKVNEGEIVALLGENGAGKTTLMNILFGHYQADDGYIEVFDRRLEAGSTRAALDAGVGMVHQHFALAHNLSVLDNIMLGTQSLWSLCQDRAGARRKLAEISALYGLSCHPDQRVGNLSVGERQRVEILKALYRDAKVLILDEPTAVLTPQETDNLLETLKSLKANGLAVIFISHKLREILAISDRIAVLRRGHLIADVLRHEADRDMLAELMVGRHVERPRPLPMLTGNPVLRLNDVSLRNADGRSELRDVNLEIKAHEIVGIAGVAGNGQRPLADLLSGLRTDFTGTMEIAGQSIEYATPHFLVATGVGRIPEDRQVEGVVGEMAVWENLLAESIAQGQTLKAGGIIDKSTACNQATELIERFDIRCNGPNARTEHLSGGNMQKLILARVLTATPQLIIANQPVRGLDEGAIAFVQGQLLAARERGAGILLISEDLDELRQLADRIAVIHDGRLSIPFDPAAHDNITIGLMMAGHEAAHAA